ncbi:MAG: alpha/beta hydrolase [Clostridia bacterium]|nr:alpha/beta hydrolase [Clostridia bacterium]
MIEQYGDFTVETEEIGAGRPVLLLHGWGYGHTLLNPLARELATQFRVLMPDMPGHGASPDPKKPMTVYDYAHLVQALIEKRGWERVDIVAHSFGCRLALILAATQPRLVNKMVLCGAAGIRDKRGAAYYVRVWKYKIAKFFLRLFAPSKFEEWRKNKGSEDYRVLSDTMKVTFQNIVNEDLSPLLRRVKAPTFLIWGEKDTATPLWMAEKMEQEIPDCAKVVYLQRTHYAFLEESARTLAIVRTFFGE